MQNPCCTFAGEMADKGKEPGWCSISIFSKVFLCTPALATMAFTALGSLQSTLQH